MNPDSAPDRKPQRLRERLKEATSEAILGAAERVFAEHGLHGARMEDIALAAGVSVGTLYNYFADRGALFSALLDLRRSELIHRLDDTLSDQGDASFEVELESLFGTLFAHFEEHRAFFAIALASEHMPESQRSIASSRDTMKALYARFEAVVTTGVTSRVLSPDHAALYPALLMGMARGVLMRSLYDVSLGSTGPRARELVQLFLNGARRST